jgi:hypothetical protein
VAAASNFSMLGGPDRGPDHAFGISQRERVDARRRHRAQALTPIDRFGLDLSRIRFLPPNEVNDELFWVEHERTVLADNTFSVQRQRFECPRDLRSRKVQVQVRFDRKHLTRIAVFYKGERVGEARPLNRVANDRKRNAAKEAAS